MKKRNILLATALLSVGSVFAQTLPDGMTALLPSGVTPNITQDKKFIMQKNLTVAGSPEKGYYAFFSASDSDHGEELWVTDGTPEGTRMVKDINPGVATSDVNYLTRFNDKVVFSADNGEDGYQLWISDGTEEGTRMVKKIHEFDSSNPIGFCQMNETQFIFFASDYESENFSSEGAQKWLYVSDGTEEGTKLVAQVDCQFPGEDIDHRYGAVRSLDYGETWEDVSDQVFFPRGIRHGTAFAVDVSIVESLIADRNYNPLIPDNLADPSVSKFGDTYYLYGTTDLDYGLGRAGTPVVWKSKDFVNWSFEGSHISGFDWSKGYDYKNDKGEKKKGYFRYWAPGKVIEQDGKFYLYVTFVKPDDKMGTYVLVADRPDGPFHFTAGQGLLPPGEEGTDSPAVVDDIDGEPFINDDGSGYIFWRRRNAGRLSADRLHLDGEPVTLATARQGYSEGPVMFKRKGIYYYIYTLSGHQNYVNAYMMSRESPLTGFVKPEGNDIFLFSSPENQVWGPGHGNVFYDEGTDEYIFLYLEYGDGGTTRQVYANRMEFNDDGTIKTLIPDMRGVGYLAASQETRPNLALQSHFYASSEKSPRTSVVNIETQPNQPLPEKGSVKSYTRTHTYQATHVADESNGTRWMAADTDSSPFITVDLKEIRKVGECQLYFTRPTEGHTWRLEKSIDGKHWQMCAEQGKVQVCSPHIAKEIGETRYLRLHIRRGDAGLWEWKIYE